MPKDISVSKSLYYPGGKCGVLQTLASVLSWDVMFFFFKSKHSTWTGAVKCIQSIIMFTWYISGIAKKNTNNMLKLTDLVKNYVA